MNKITIVFINGDRVVIDEPHPLPTRNKVINQIIQSNTNALIRADNGDTIIPLSNILFVTSSPCTVNQSDKDNSYEIQLWNQDQQRDTWLYRVNHVWIISSAECFFHSCMPYSMHYLFPVFWTAWTGNHKLVVYLWSNPLCLFWLCTISGNVYGGNHFYCLLFTDTL